MSMQDLTNNKSMESVMNVKANKEKFEQVAENVRKELPEPQQKGLMAPKLQQEEMI
jgi:hypothetical protein